MYVAVTGPPASGKTTLAAPLARELGLALVAKDTLKSALLTVLPPVDLAASQRMGAAAVAGILAIAGDNPGGVLLDSVWHRSRALPELAALPGPLVEVFCRCDREVVRRRYRDRADSRPPTYFDHQRLDEELWNDEVAVPVAGGWPVLEVDTSAPVDVTALAARVRAAAE